MRGRARSAEDEPVRPDPESRLAELMREVRRHRDAIHEFRLSSYPEVVSLHEAELRKVYAQIRRHCREHGLILPRDIPND
jgi:hypothetical protein